MQRIHHANIVLGEGGKEFVFEILERELNFVVKNNPDFFFLEADAFGIDDARGIEKWAMGKPLLGGAKVSLLLLKSLTFEAQNALLKVLEEPPLNTFFFIGLENLGGILPTFMSRVVVLDAGSVGENPRSKFLSSGIDERLSLIRSLVKKEDKAALKEFISDLEKISYAEFAHGNAGSLLAAKKILAAKIFASARGSSPKMLLEWLSCVV